MNVFTLKFRYWRQIISFWIPCSIKIKSFDVNSNIFATHSFLQNENHAPVETGVAISVTREFYLLKFVEKTRESSSDAKVRHLDSRELIIINF